MTGQETLIPEIRGLKGNRAYLGIDRENNAMTNVSVWDTRGDAEQMATLQPMLNLAKIFIMPGAFIATTLERWIWSVRYMTDRLILPRQTDDCRTRAGRPCG